MVDIASIAGALSALQTAGEIAKGMIGLSDTAKIQGKVIELQSAILAAQSNALSAQAEQSSLLSRIGDLEKEIAKVKAWEAEKENYELFQFRPGAFAYRFKTSVDPAKPAHEICATCYESGVKSILQHDLVFPGRKNIARCDSCGAVITINGPAEPPLRPAVRIKRPGDR